MTWVRLKDARARRLKPAASEYSVHDKAVPSLNVWREAWAVRCKPAMVSGRDRVLRSRILPAFGSLRLDRITRADVQNWFDAYSASAPGGANFTLRILRQSLKFAVERGLIGSNPAAAVLPNRQPRHSRFLSRNEIRRLNEALDWHAEGPLSAQADIVRLLLLTGCRKMEIVRLKRSEVDGGRLRLDDGKTGPRTVHLSPEAGEIIKRRMNAPGKFLFPFPVNPGKPVSGNLKPWHRIRREIGIEDVRMHDLRRSFASQCVI